jgi:predicted MPP superfamily phosphohydrolase
MNKIDNFIKAIKQGKFQNKTIVTIPNNKNIILVGDLHGRIDNLGKILNKNNNLDNISNGNLILIILGDAVHNEVDLIEMDSSIKIMDMIMELKTNNPNNVYYLLGNHDYLSDNFSKGGVRQGMLYREKLIKEFGNEYIKKYEEFIKVSPLVAIGQNFVATHASPTYATLKEILETSSIDEESPIVNQLTWGRYNRDYDDNDVNLFLETINKSTATLIVGHSPHLIPVNSFYVKLSKNHFVIFAGRTLCGYVLINDNKINFITC